MWWNLPKPNLVIHIYIVSGIGMLLMSFDRVLRRRSDRCPCGQRSKRSRLLCWTKSWRRWRWLCLRGAIFMTPQVQYQPICVIIRALNKGSHTTIQSSKIFKNLCTLFFNFYHHEQREMIHHSRGHQHSARGHQGAHKDHMRRPQAWSKNSTTHSWTTLSYLF